MKFLFKFIVLLPFINAHAHRPSGELATACTSIALVTGGVGGGGSGGGSGRRVLSRPTLVDGRRSPTLPPKLIEGAKPIPGRRSIIVDFFEDSENPHAFCNIFFNTPLHAYKAEMRALIKDARIMLGGEHTHLYDHNVKALKALHMTALLPSGGVSTTSHKDPCEHLFSEGIVDEAGMMDAERRALEKPMGKKTKKRSTLGMTERERAHLTVIQSLRLSPGELIAYNGPAMELLGDLFAAQFERIMKATEASDAMNKRLMAAGRPDQAERFGPKRNYAAFTLALFTSEGLREFPFPGHFSSGTTPLGIEGVEFSDYMGSTGITSPEFGDVPVFCFDATFPGDVKAAHDEMLGYTPGDAFGPAFNKLDGKVIEQQEHIFAKARAMYPAATRAFFESATAEELDKVSDDKLCIAYQHSEQALLAVLEKSKWINQVIESVIAKGITIRGAVNMIGTRRDACVNCARAMYEKALGGIYEKQGPHMRRIPHATVVTGWETYKQHGLVGGVFTQRHDSRAAALGFQETTLRLGETPFITYAAAPAGGGGGGGIAAGAGGHP